MYKRIIKTAIYSYVTAVKKSKTISELSMLFITVARFPHNYATLGCGVV